MDLILPLLSSLFPSHLFDLQPEDIDLFEAVLYALSSVLNFPTLSPASHLFTHSLQLLNLLLQDCTVIEKVTVVLLVLTETLTGVTELNRKGIFLFQQLRELK